VELPRAEHDGRNDIGSLDDYTTFVEERVGLVDAAAERYGIDCKIAAILGMDFWQGSEPDRAARAAGYSVAMDVLKDHGLTRRFPPQVARDGGYARGSVGCGRVSHKLC